MTYQGARAAAAKGEVKRVFAVSKVRLDASGHPTHVLWVEVNAKSNLDVGKAVAVPVADVVDAIHDGARVVAVFQGRLGHVPERAFEVIEHAEGSETLGLIESSGLDESLHQSLHDMATLDEEFQPQKLASPSGPKKPVNTFAVSKVALDTEGRVTAVLWGRVNTGTNSWASPEVFAPVAEAVNALRAGDQVFALFPSAHGHLPDRQFVAIDYDDGRETIVLDGPTAHEREIHDMDRLSAHSRR